MARAPLVAALAWLATPTLAQTIDVEGSGLVNTVGNFAGVTRTGTVNPGDVLAFGFTFDPASSVINTDGGSMYQGYSLVYTNFAASVGGATFTPDPDTVNNAYLGLGTGFSFLGGPAFSEPAYIQEFGFRGTGAGLPFATTGTATVTFTLTSFFRQNLIGTTPTLANLRDPGEAAINRFRLTVFDHGRTLGSAQGNFTADFAAAAIPEPETWALLIVGLGAIGAAMRRRRAPTPRFF